MRTTPLKTSIALGFAAVVACAGVLASAGAAATDVKPPRYINPPAVTTVRVGQTLTVSPGQWVGATPMSFYYTWMYGKPGLSTPIPGATGRTYTLTRNDIGKSIWVQVKATNSAGHFWANSAPTPAVAGPSTTDGITLADGRTSMPVQQVTLPNRLVVATALFDPLRMAANGSATMQVTVVDRYRRPVRGALVQVTALPFGSLNVVPSAVTNASGVATITLHGRPKVLDHVPGSAIALYLQATKPGGDPSTGVSGTRLVQLKFSH